MHLVAINIETIQLGQPLPFVLRGADGALLANKGYVIRNRAELDVLLARGLRLCVDTDESGGSHRAYLAQLQRMLLSQTSLGEIASMKITAASQAAQGPAAGGPPDWPELQARATQLLRSPAPADFVPRLHALHDELARHCQATPDAVLLALIYLTAEEPHLYSATHALLVACACTLVAHETLHWPPARVRRAGLAALTMNIAMTALQDQLAVQADMPSAAQMAAIQDHAEEGAALLRSLGVQDPVWLEAVRLHHHRAGGALAALGEGGQIARLVQRADVLGARIAPRVSRPPMPVTAAMQASYYDEQRQVDEIGAALVKTLGVYPPGTFVRLASQEVALVLRRGPSATTPRVAVVVNREGMPTGEMIPRDTTQAAWKVAAAVPRRAVRVQISLSRLLSLA